MWWLADYFHVDAKLTRLIMLVALFMSGGAVGLAYIVARFIVPWDHELESP